MHSKVFHHRISEGLTGVVSRSAQLNISNIKWLKAQGYTDVLNFRTMVEPEIGFDEAQEVIKNGMNYHSLPVSGDDLKNGRGMLGKIGQFLKIVFKVKASGGKLHMHCKAGADRTGVFAFIYKSLFEIGTREENAAEMLHLGHNTQRYPDVISDTKKIIDKIA